MRSGALGCTQRRHHRSSAGCVEIFPTLGPHVCATVSYLAAAEIKSVQSFFPGDRALSVDRMRYCPGLASGLSKTVANRAAPVIVGLADVHDADSVRVRASAERHASQLSRAWGVNARARARFAPLDFEASLGTLCSP